MADLKFEIIKKIGVLSETEKGWKKENNVIVFRCKKFVLK